MVKKLLPIILICFVSLIFFYPFFLKGKLPIPADTIVGLYHPYRDVYAKDYPRGIPFKNFLITDPVRQLYPWRRLSIEIWQMGQLPLWNPYSMAGMPLLGNFQSGAFYPFNIVFFIFPFHISWTILIILQPLLAAYFMYLFLKRFNLNPWACVIGALSYAFSGFFIAWLEWNTILHVALWLPLLLLAKEELLRKVSFFWIAVFLFAECSAIFAGHLQTYFYFFLVSNAYLFVRIFQLSAKDRRKNLLTSLIKRYKLFLILGAIVFALTAVQWYPTTRFILESARSVDQTNFHKEGFFIPWKHLIQFLAPDFFGNPTTLNYWGVWNYGELVGYVGIIPLIMAFCALFYRKDKKTIFFAVLAGISLVLSTDNLIARIPYQLQIPFLSTAQPTRLLFIADFSLAVLATLGFDLFLQKKKRIHSALFVVGGLYTLLWILVFMKTSFVPLEFVSIAKRNLLLPTIIFSTTFLISFLMIYTKKKHISIILLSAFIFLTIFDLVRFGIKFTPFTQQEYLYPSSQTIEFLTKNVGIYRIMSLDARILPPNFLLMHKLQTIEGYDPLYLKRYGELITASERGKPNISPPFGFNRIITPHNYDSKIIDLLGVKYVLSLLDIQSSKLKKVFQEGQTQIYENKQVFPRIFFVDSVIFVNSKEEAMQKLFDPQIDLRKIAVIEFFGNIGKEEEKYKPTIPVVGTIKINDYRENVIKLEVENNRDAFLLLTDSYYPTWKVTIDSNPATLYRADYNFRGVLIPKGEHIVEFYNTLL